jgi:hypothetical protein
MATQIIDLGQIRFVWQGEWIDSDEYELNDAVRYGGNVYIYINELPATGALPTDATKWGLALSGSNFEGTYNNSANYGPGDVVRYGAFLYRCTAATTGNLPTDTAKWAVYLEGTSWQGEYSEIAAYKKNDIVIYGGSTYIAVIATTGNIPTDDTYWDLFAYGYPDTTDNEGKLLTTDGTDVSWTNTVTLDTAAVETKFTSEAYTYIGIDAEAFETDAELTSAAMVIDIEGVPESFAQVAFRNSAPTSSTDIIAYANNGDDSNGWVGIGITGSRFDDTTYGITGQGDSYVFGQAPAASAERTVTNKLAGSGTATLTTSVNHGFLVGERVVVASVDAALNGAHTITAKTDNTFSFASVATISTTSASGTATVKSAGNLVIATGDNGSDNKIVFAAGGYASGNTQMVIIPDETVHIEIATSSTSATTGALVVAGGVGITGDTFTDGDLTLDGLLYAGPGAEVFSTAATLTSPAVVASIAGDENSFAQIAFHNEEPTSSTDIIVYMDNGNDSNGWMGMGIAGSEFDDATFGITAPGDGYIFHNAIDDTYLGNMVFATGAEGSENKIIFAAGGFDSGLTQMEITPGVNVHVEIDTPSTSPTTGALTVVGGVGVQGDMNVEGSVFIEGTITFGGSGTTVETANLSVTDPAVFVGTNNQSDIVDLAFIGEYATTISTITRTITNKALAANVATLTTSVPHTYLLGDVVVVTDVDATFNGTFNITAVGGGGTTFSYAKTAGNVSSTAVSPTGTAEVSARRKFAGLARDASDGVLKAFKDATTKPTSTINFAEAGLAYADLKLNAIDAASATIGDVSNTELQYLNGVTSDIQTQLNNRSLIASPTFTGTPAAPTAAVDTNTTQIATTGYVVGQGYLKSSTATSTYAPLTSAALVTPTISRGVLTSAIETTSLFAASATGTLNYDVSSSSVVYYTSNSSANFTLNFRGNVSTTLNSILSTGQSVTTVFLNTNGSTAYYPTAIQVDGAAVTVAGGTLRWQGGTAPTSGSASSVDSYSFTIIKTGNAAFTVFAAQIRFA